MFAFDAIGAYNFDDALAVGSELDRLRATWFEAPLDPEDVSSHARLAQELKTPIAIGETLRTVREFEPWVEKKALEVAQPDIVRCGITGGGLIVDSLKDKVSVIAPHIGVCTAIGMAATWHFAAGLQGEHWQEHQFDLFNTGNKVIEEPLAVRNGLAQISTEPGLGITVNESFVRAHSTQTWFISEHK
jgi:L-alanine-DL-glutamate epimerase-like enolase superfamily enzyme